MRPTDEPIVSLAELQPFDTVILANVPREAFTDEQISMLVRNTHTMGSGLIMLGGENSFGAGGWTNTELEKAMPVDFQIKNAKVSPVGALVMVMHASEMAEGNFWQARSHKPRSRPSARRTTAASCIGTAPTTGCGQPAAWPRSATEPQDDAGGESTG